MKKLTIITQRVDINDENLGFFHRWIEKFAENLDEVCVICLRSGDCSLPLNVKVYSLGREKGVNKVFQFFRLQFYLLRNLLSSGGVFVHMSPVYAIFAFPLAALFRKKILMWYVHRSNNWALNFAEKLVGKVYTASAESFSVKSHKVEVVGHGIDTKHFIPARGDGNENEFRILYVGRIAPIKDLETLVASMYVLVNDLGEKDARLEIVGTSVDSEEAEYFKKIQGIIEKKQMGGYVTFAGGARYAAMPERYKKGDVVVNLSPKGGMDKTVLEAMSCGIPVLCANETFKPLLSGAGIDLMFTYRDAQGLAEKLKELKAIGYERRGEIGMQLREVVVTNHNLDNLVKKIMEYFYGVRA